MPAFLRPDDTAPVRDAIIAGLTALCLAIQDRAAYAADQANVLRATGKYLDEIGAKERGILREGDLDPAYRARILTAPSLVAPTYILAGVNAILAGYTSVTAKYMEPNSDRFTVPKTISTSVSQGAFIYKRGSVPRSPDYLDRLYVSEAAQNGGVFIPNREPGDCRIFKDEVGRYFFIRVPDLSSVNAQDTPVYQELQANDFYVGTSTANSWTSYVLKNSTTSATLYAAICNVVNRLKGHSMRWTLWVDPYLTS
jgi:hypothetical protein